MFDPDTKESLGQLETVKGTVEPLHIQEKLTTLQSNEFEIVKGEVKEIITSNTNSKSTSLGLALMGFNSADGNKTSEIITPAKKEKKRLNNVKIGDLVKQI